jgi:predicted membrane-bound spermidine synthase
MKRYILEIVVFCTGAVVMVLEIVGSRIMAPYLGNSLIVWTSLIGIILACLSFGYWWGGRLADKNANSTQLANLILLAAIFTALIAWYKTPVLSILGSYFSNIQFASVIGALALFGLPSILLGTVAPYAIVLKLNKVDQAGATSGRLYAISTVGSIVGTFAAGFFLIAFFGVTKILFLLALVLLFASALLRYPKINKLTLILVAALLVSIYVSGVLNAFAAAEGTVVIDTQYNHVIVQDGFNKDNKPARYLVTNIGEAQSGIFLDSPNELVFDYTYYYRLADHFTFVNKGLMLGGAGYTYPRDFLREHSNATIDVVEIDPGMTKIAKQYFELKNNERITIYHQDGRIFLNQNNKKYDAIYMDAFSAHYMLPPHLTTKEAVQKMSDSLEPNGVVIVNTVSALSNDKSSFLKAEYRTYKEVFPQVYLFPVSGINDRNVIQNVMIVALKSIEPVKFKSNNPKIQELLDNRLTSELPSDLPVLTDELAPVEYYVNELVRD